MILSMQLAFAVNCYSADTRKIVKLKTQIVKTKDDTTQVKILNEIAESYYYNDQLDSCMKYATQSCNLADNLLQKEQVKTNNSYYQRCNVLLALATRLIGLALESEDSSSGLDTLKSALGIMKKAGDKNGIGTIHQSLGWMYEYRSQNDLALEQYQIAKSIYEETGNNKKLGYLLSLIGINQRYKGNYGDAIESQMQALKIGKEIKDTLTMKEALLALAFTFAKVEKWNEALEYQKQSLDLLTHWKDSSGIARVYNDIGVTYMSMDSMDVAIKNHLAALAIRKIIKEYYSISSSNFYLGSIYFNQNRYEKALECFNEAMKYSKKSGYSMYIIDSQLKIGNVYQKMGNEKLAMKNFQEALEFSQKSDNWMGGFMASVAIAEVYLKNGKTSIAIKWLNKAASKAPQTAFHELNIVYKKLANAHILEGDYKNGYKYFLLHSQTKDSLLSYENSEKITILTNRLDYEKKQALQNESHEKMIQLKQAEINRQKIVRNFSLFGMGVILIMAIIFFIRFIEKNKLNTQLNITLSNLKSTQTQLVHAEKMASLGELTAGVAHEIQNPLNFVNNFSELNTELIEELKEELKEGNLAEVKAIVDDIIENESKINQHGKRADAIVRGMLQHSRRSTGEKEPTDVNALVDEYLRLSFHGLRAKDKNFNAEFETRLDNTLPKINVVPQDFGRVMLNLINNAFYAVNEKQKQLNNDYKPGVLVSTKLIDKNIEIKVRDNGNGIPEKILEKIFQPFFTTKSSGEGTGLGLSLSYDIITKGHNGVLKVETKEGEGSEFIIRLKV